MNPLEVAFRAMVDVSWRTSCLVLVVLVLRSALRGRLPARVMSWVWIAVAIRLLFPFAMPATWSPFNYATLDLRTNAEVSRDREAKATPPVVTGLASPAAPTGPAAAAALPAWRPHLTLARWAALAWGIGVVALVLARVLAYAGFLRALRRSGRNPDPAAALLLAGAANQLGAQPIPVTVTNVVCAPALHGILRPRLLFPEAFLEKLTPREIQLTVAHELAHAERRDLLASTLMHVAVILHWFNPFVWLVARLARNDCELACDERVLGRLGTSDRVHYGATLLRIVNLANGCPSPRFGLGVAESKQQIKRRIQMIAAHPSPTLARTAFGGVLFASLTALSFTREVAPQTSPTVVAPESTPVTRLPVRPPRAESKFAYDPSTDRLDVLFPTGVAATVGDRAITVADIRREVAPLIPSLQRDARTQDEFNQKVSRLQNSVIGDLIGRFVLIKKFHDHREGENAKAIPESFIDNRIADTISTQFDNDRAKFLANLRDRGLTIRNYRKQVEEDIIYHYMRSPERNADGKAKEKKAAEERTGPQVHLRIIQLSRATEETDATLLVRANAVLARFRNGESFESLAKEFSADPRKDRGGDWGWQRPENLKAQFRDALFALKKGEASTPFVLKEGCFLLYAEDRK